MTRTLRLLFLVFTCTIAVAPPGGDWRAVNACLLLLPQLDGHAVVTVEGEALIDEGRDHGRRLGDQDAGQHQLATGLDARVQRHGFLTSPGLDERQTGGRQLREIRGWILSFCGS